METIEYKNPTVDKASWGAGEWIGEPDKKQWLDEATGLPCLIVRNIHCTGALCGYVGIKEGHPFYGKEYNDMACPMDTDLDVHGGLTFSGECQEAQNDCEGICHKVEGDDKVWWVGFDCAHSGDLCPQMNSYINRNARDEYFNTDDRYRNIAYVTAQVQHLAAQLSKLSV